MSLQQTPSRLRKWIEGLESTQKHNFISQYQKLEDIHSRLTRILNLYPPRACWEDVFTAKCKETPCCWKCRDCRRRFSQATIVVVAAQGTRDSLCLPHFGAVFRHPRYRKFSIEEWSSISFEEMTMVYSKASKQSISAMYVHLFLGDLAQRTDLPKEVHQITHYKGFQKKSACLLLSAMDPELVVGIPVDRHLATGFKVLGWADPLEPDATNISKMVELWLPQEKWAQCNVVCAGLRQVWQSQFYRARMVAAAEALGQEHLDLLTKSCSCDAVAHK